MIGTPKKLGCNERGYRIGESHHNSTIPDRVVTLIRDMHENECLTFRDISERLHLPFWTVKAIACYKRRAQVPRQWREVEVKIPPGVTLAPTAVQCSAKGVEVPTTVPVEVTPTTRSADRSMESGGG